MGKYIFLYKEQNTDDRDAVKYIEIDREIFECGHYFTGIGLTGACYSQSLRLDNIDFDNITTILTKEEFEQLDEFNKEIKDLGYGIVKDSERYKKGLELRETIKPILEKLKSEENKALFEEVKKEEIEYLKDEQNLDDEEVEQIFEHYELDYRDRAIVHRVFADVEECGEEYVESCMDIPEHLENYIDYKRLGCDLLENEQYIQLFDERVVYLSY